MKAGLAFLTVLLAAAPVLAAPTPPYFTDVTAAAGLNTVQAFRIAVADLDGDGYQDIVVHLKPDPATGDVLAKQVVLLNRPASDPEGPFPRVFVDFTAESGIGANRQGTTEGRHSDAAIFGDVDNDGDVDVFTNVYVHRTWALNKGKNDLLLNDGTGRFTLAPASPFHNEPIYNTAAEVFIDYDRDGKLDLWTGNWYCGWTAPWCQPGLGTDGLTWDQLYRGGGDGTFTNVTVAAGLNAAATVIYGIAAFDHDGDGDVDLFAPPYSHTSVYSTPRHWRNNGNGTFTQVQAATNYDDYRGFGSNVASFGSIPFDYDNDGDMDFAEVLTHGGSDTGKYSGPVRNGGGVFTWNWSWVQGRGTEDPNTAHDGDHHLAWTDFDGDTLADYVLTESGYDNNRILLFRQGADHVFRPDTVSSGFNDINTSNLPPGNVIPVDVDRDGDEDLLIGLDGQPMRLYRNDVGNLSRWLAVTLRGVGGPGYSNKSAVGATVAVTAGGVTQTRVVAAGNGHQGPQAPFTLTFGVGQASVVDLVRVRWPSTSGAVSELTGLAVDREITILEPCDYATNPSDVRVDKSGGDLVLSWSDPAMSGWTWNVHRGPGPDSSTWGPPHATGVTDGDPGSPGIQYQDVGAGGGGSYFYLTMAVNHCGETPAR